jgi:hypothetical protein
LNQVEWTEVPLVLESVDQVLLAWTEVALQGNWTDEMEKLLEVLNMSLSLGGQLLIQNGVLFP